MGRSHVCVVLKRALPECCETAAKIICGKETIDNSRHEITSVKRLWQGTEQKSGRDRGSGTGQPHAGQGSNVTRMRKWLMSEMDPPKQQKEVCTDHSEYLHSSPSAPRNTQQPVQAHRPIPGWWKAAALPEGRDKGSALLFTPQPGTTPTSGSWGSFGSSRTRQPVPHWCPALQAAVAPWAKAGYF